ncbi:lipopolysaccharide biosynthesis protein [Streptomyces sp. H27-D2]|uniref:lipopolysaccharide biosynthesis protein n=1 Tax=Streptomyces sp. H27-D2 TaxID=3046304 RepID=UPI002DBA2536|nr:lipopolysaccharide biosynthesis protein [Streptomyces sp. H27-D2]MEC4017823.1 lipopolysaccharide biosynthesis protein [Streptomyces sp. H27-D2]
MTEQPHAAQQPRIAQHTQHTQHAQDEPDLLRDQFRQLLRYRVLLVSGVLLGLLGGAWMGVTGADAYVATSEVTVRSATVDPFAPGGTAPDKQVSIGSERQTALSNTVAARAANSLGVPGDTEKLQAGLQVTNPPNTLVLRFAFTATSPKAASDRANAVTRAYLDNRRKQTQSLIDNMVKGYEKQLAPLVKQRNEIADEIAGLSDGRALDSTLSLQSTLIGKISELNSSISKLKALDATPGFVVRTAVPPSAPAGPGLVMTLGMGAAVGLGLGLLAAWVRLVFDPTVRSEGDVVRALRAPVLGTLPRSRRRQDPNALLAEGRLAEEYRSVAFRLAYDQRFAERRRLLVVAPRGNSETASAVSVNLAASFVEMGREVLLVEADLRTPSLSAKLRSADGIRPGWARTPARGDNGWPTGLQVPIDAGESGAFDLIPGSRVRNVARALTSTPATQLIDHADAPGSVVVVLAPAVLSYADAIALADRVDGVLVVCDPKEVHRDDLDRVRELISGAGGSVLGAVLHSNGSGPKRGATGARRRTGSEEPTEDDRQKNEPAEPATADAAADPAAATAVTTAAAPAPAVDDGGPETLGLRLDEAAERSSR